MLLGPTWTLILVAAKKKEMKSKSNAPTQWDTDDTMYPRKYTECKVCGRYGEMKLAWDLRGYLCIHPGKCIARRSRTEDEPEG